MEKSPYLFEVFDTRNTSFTQEVPLAQSLSVARHIAKRLSLQHYKVVLWLQEAREEFEEYQGFKCVSATSPEAID